MSNFKKIILFFLPILFLVFLMFYFNLKENNSIFSYSNKDNIENKNINEFQISISVNDPIIGNKKAPITIIAFADFACAACKIDSMILDKLINENPNKIKVIWKALPVSFYPYNSSDAIKYAYCANKQNKFPEFKNLAYTNNFDLSSSTLQNISQEIELNEKKLNTCLNDSEKDNYIEMNKNYANILNIQEVPTYFLNNKQITPKNENEWKLILNL